MSTNTAKTGSIRICRVQNLGRIKADIKIAAVQAMSKPIKGVTVCPELAGDDAMMAFKNEAKEQKLWDKETFNQDYVPMYLNRLSASEARRTLNQIYKAVKDGKTVAIGCYCADEATCKRSVIAGLYQGLGLEVSGVKGDYSAYYAKWQTEYKKPTAPAAA